MTGYKEKKWEIKNVFLVAVKTEPKPEPVDTYRWNMSKNMEQLYFSGSDVYIKMYDISPSLFQFV